MTLRVLHVTDSLIIGGKERMIVEISNASLNLGIQVGVCVTRNNLDLSKDLKSNIVLKCLNRQSKFDLNGMLKFKNFVNEFKPDIFHAHNISSFSFLALAKKIKVIHNPIIFHDHHGFNNENYIPYWFKLWGSKMVDAYVGVYDKSRKWALDAGIPKNKIHVIDNSININKFKNIIPKNLREEYKIPSDGIIGVAIGRISYDKGQDLIVDALASLCNRNVFVFFIGAEVDENFTIYLKRKIMNSFLEEKIFFLGSQYEIPEILKCADFGIHASRSESGPLVLVEFLASGLPFVVSNTGGISQKVKDLGLSGIYDCDDNNFLLTSELRNLLSLNKETRILRGRQGLEVSYCYFNIDKTIYEWRDLYSKIIE